MASIRTITVRDVAIGGKKPLVVIAGPCVLEKQEMNFTIAGRLKEVTSELGMPLIFKASYDKGNRGVSSSYRGPMIDEGLAMLAEISERFDVPVLTDVHSEDEAAKAAEAVDMLQVPAYLCMQTSLIECAARTGKPLNVKKGQFLAPDNAAGIIKKVDGCGNGNLMLTERGTVFGYNNLVSDIRALPIMRNLGVPVAYDATHIIRRPGISSSAPEGGQPEYVPHLIRAAVAAGVDALFIETHPEPRIALCDASSMLPLARLEELLRQAKAVDELVKRWDLSVSQRGEDGFLP